MDDRLIDDRPPRGALHLVTGIGPRCGTSTTVLREAARHDARIWGEAWPAWCVPETCPDGAWEAPFWRAGEASRLRGAATRLRVVAKVWPQWLALVPPTDVASLVVCYRRDREAQLASMERVRQAEVAAGIHDVTCDHPTILQAHLEAVLRYLHALPSSVPVRIQALEGLQ